MGYEYNANILKIFAFVEPQSKSAVVPVQEEIETQTAQNSHETEI